MERDRSSVGGLTREEFMEIASPPCHECGAPINCVEHYYFWIHDDNHWGLGRMVMVCTNRHRIEVEDIT